LDLYYQVSRETPQAQIFPIRSVFPTLQTIELGHSFSLPSFISCCLLGLEVVNNEFRKRHSVFLRIAFQAQIQTHNILEQKLRLVACLTLQMLQDASLEHVQDGGVISSLEELIPFLCLDVVQFNNALGFKSWVSVGWL